MLFQALGLAILAIGGHAAPSKQNHVVHEKRAASDAMSSARVRVARDAVVPVRIGLTQRNLDQGYDLLMDVSHPNSANYGKHWTADEVHEMFGPADDTIEAVKNWLINSGIDADKISYSRQGWLSMDVPAHQAEDLLQTQYYEQPSHDGSVRLGCDEYSLPRHVSTHVDYVKPGIALSPPMKKRSTGESYQKPRGGPRVTPYIPPSGPVPASAQDLPPELQNCGTVITPACVFALYNITTSTTADSSNVLGIYEGGQAYNQDDLNSYFANYATQIPAGTGPTDVSINGGQAPSPDGQASLEADVDFSIAYYIIYPQSTVNYQDSSPSVNEDDDSWVTGFLDAVDGSFCSDEEKSAGLDCGTANLTTIVSVSYVSPELGASLAGQNRSCNEFMKLGLQGHTFLYASGDWGVAYGPNDTANGCFDPTTNSGVNGPVFNPIFPATCPYVLAVGATQIEPDGTPYVPESAMYTSPTFSSGGGFSNYFPAPSYQQSALDSYFNNSDPGYATYTSNGQDVLSGQGNIGENGGLYNRAGRGYPDVSANGVNFAFYLNGGLVYGEGTSLATPLWASILTLINENRTAEGKGPVGFVNPVLYQNPGAFIDITNGTNPGCGVAGFSAVPGWDPITGLGTPNFPSLLNIFASLQ